MADQAFIDSKGVTQTFIDSDTLRNKRNKNDIRLIGWDGRETDTLMLDDDGNPVFKRGEIGGEAYTDAVAALRKQGGFDNVDYTGTQGFYGRDLAELRDDKGNAISDTLYSSGIAPLGKYSTEEQTTLRREGELVRSFLGNSFDPYKGVRENLNDALEREGLRFKGLAIDESEFDSDFHSDVMFRNPDRTLSNRPRGLLSAAGESFGVGWDGIREGFWGYADAIGQTTGIEMIENLGETGVVRARDRIANAPELILDYKQVNNISNGFEYLLNNAAMSAPYMITTFAAFAAAIPVAGLTGLGIVGARALTALPNSIVYAGQTWNEMEGDKGASQFIVASLSGIGQSTLEFLAIPALIAPVQLFSKAGQAKVIRHLQNTRGMSAAQAEKTLANALGKKQKEFLTSIASMRIKPSDIASFSAGQIPAAAGRGAALEALTEIGQESLQMSTAAGFSDKEYTQEEVLNRLINAGIAGGSLGGSLSAASNIYQQGKNRLTRAQHMRRDQERNTDYQKWRQGKVQSGEKINSVDENINEADARALTNTKDNIANATLDPAPVSSRDDRTATMSDKELAEILEGKPSTNQRNEKGELRYSSPLREAELTLEAIEENAKDKTDPEYIKAVKTAKANIDRARKFEERVRAEIAGRKDGTLKQLTFEEADALLDEREADQQAFTSVAGLTLNENARDRFLTVLHDSYMRKQKGIKNLIKNNNTVAEYSTQIAVGVSKFFRGLERVSISSKKAIQSDRIMDVMSRVFGALGDAVHPGMNFKEYQEDIIRKAKSLIDEIDIVTRYKKKVRGMRHKDALDISAFLIAYGNQDSKIENYVPRFDKNGNEILENKPSHAAYATYIALQRVPNLLDLINQYTNNLVNKDRVEIIFKDLGIPVYDAVLRDAAIRQFKQILESKKYGFKAELKNGKIVYTRLPAGELKNIADSSSDIELLDNNYNAAVQLKASYDYLWHTVNERRKAENPGYQGMMYDIDGWWKHQGFSWKKAKADPNGFKKFLMSKPINLTKEAADAVYENIAKRGEVTINLVDTQKENPNAIAIGAKYSLLNEGNKGYPWSFSEDAAKLFDAKDADKWLSGNLFESINKTQVDSARYVANAKYFGEGGKKLHRLFLEIAEEGVLSDEELKQFAYYIKSSIDSANGNFNRIESPKLAALNSFISSWSVLSGLPLSAPSSFPEFSMLFFDIKDDQMFNQAASTLMKQLGGAFDEALKAQVIRGEKLTKLAKLDVKQSTVADRLATGERDVSFMRLHDTFFRGVGITTVTQLQRRLAAVIGLDAIKHAFDILDLAPTKTIKKQLGNGVERNVSVPDFDNYKEIEMEVYNQLVSLGIDVERMQMLFADMDSLSRHRALEITEDTELSAEPDPEANTGLTIKEPSPREKAIRKMIKNNYRASQAEGVAVPSDYEQTLINEFDSMLSEITDEISNALYRYINERIQLPGHSNRPLMFMDPHFQLIFQFNGFISSFTANIIPKLYERNLKRGNIKVKYDTFALMVMLIVLGGASQYLKDLIKFGQTSPYLDSVGYMQRAVYASGVMGQYERVVDAIHPLYPQRGTGIEGLAQAFLGEAGPGVRNVQTTFTGVDQLLSGETELGLNSIFKVTPGIGPVTSLRRSGVDIMHGRNPLEGKEIPDEVDLKNFFLGTF